MFQKQNEIRKTKLGLDIALWFFLVIIILLVGWKIFNSMNLWDPNDRNNNDETNHKEGNTSREDFAKCLNQEGLIMYGIDTCEFCQAQKKMFGLAFEKVNYINCEFDQEKCRMAGITVYPVWQIGDKKSSGVKNFATLAEMSGCTQPTN